MISCITIKSFNGRESQLNSVDEYSYCVVQLSKLDFNDKIFKNKIIFQ